MYVRLAFAVAAHLEPEILIVDEVLAVGDADFQRKCLGKMNEITRREGRTILFVTHNMEMVLKLCNRALLLQAGRIHASGDVKEVLSVYFESGLPSLRLIDLRAAARDDNFARRIRFIAIAPIPGKSNWSFHFGETLAFDLSLEGEMLATNLNDIILAIDLHSARGFGLASWATTCSKTKLSLRPGRNTLRIEYSASAVAAGAILFDLCLA